MPLSNSLESWLDWLETIHPTTIDMTLERVERVAARLQLGSVEIPLITVAGTNGKGSTVAMLAAIYSANGYNVGSYTSPHIIDFRERIRINGAMVDGSVIVQAFRAIEDLREPDTLTFFEYTTLAAMQVFIDAAVDVIVLEVGLGGRLDATNLWDTDCAILTSIALDHESYLGSDRSVIATEKAAIGRPGKPFVLGELDPPDSFWAYAKEHSLLVEDIGSLPIAALPLTSLPGDHQRRNAGCAVTAVELMSKQLPVDALKVDSALMQVQIDGRFSRHQVNGITVITDVAHNPAGASTLVDTWYAEMGDQTAHLVFAALGDKDIAGVATALAPIVAHWHCAALDDARAMQAGAMQAIVEQSLVEQSLVENCLADPALTGPAVTDPAHADLTHADFALTDSALGAQAATVTAYASTADALDAAMTAAGTDDKPVLVCGSFYTIAAIQPSLL